RRLLFHRLALDGNGCTLLLRRRLHEVAHGRRSGWRNLGRRRRGVLRKGGIREQNPGQEQAHGTNCWGRTWPTPWEDHYLPDRQNAAATLAALKNASRAADERRSTRIRRIKVLWFSIRVHRCSSAAIDPMEFLSDLYPAASASSRKAGPAKSTGGRRAASGPSASTAA